MAVFTQVSQHEVQAFIEPYQIGNLIDLKGISSGIENTNYFLTTDVDTYVLTLFERLTEQQLPFYLKLMQHLAQKGICAPEPQAHKKGEKIGCILHTLKGKPATLVSKLQGKSQLQPQIHHCAQLGHELARMHLAGQDFELEQPNLRGLSWWEETIPQVRPYLNQEQSQLIHDELAYQQYISTTEAYKNLPQGPVHADLFRDNALFYGTTPEDEQLSGIFDFYFAGVDRLIYDIAVVLNDWCIDYKTGQLDLERTQALLEAYQSQRKLLPTEIELLPAILRAAALRFWTSRLWDFYLPRDAELLNPLDPTHFERVLKDRVFNPIALCAFDF